MPGAVDSMLAESRLAAAYEQLASFRRDRHYTVADFFEEAVAEQGEGPFVIFEEEAIGFAQMNRDANRVAHVAHAKGLRRGDVVGLMMENRPDYFATWLGLAKIGVVTALINPATTGRVFAHALGQIDAKALILGSECASAVATVGPDALPGMIFERSDRHALPPNREPTAYDRLLANSSPTDPDRQARAGITMADSHFLIFTSGTTGLPKAAKNSHLRFICSGVIVAGQLAFGPGDTFYCVLPLFHGAGGMVVPSLAIASRTPFVLRRRFSRSAFWSDVRRHHITGFYYIGEIVRYLLAAAPRDEDRAHTLRIMTGAGLRAELWEAFVERFGVTDILEGMGSTEGNYRLLNAEMRIGAVGRLPPPDQTNMRIARYDADAGDLYRDEAGRPVFVAPGEVGELIAEVIGGDGLLGYFEGYTSDEATEAKLTRDLVTPGDCWFRSGDLVRIDADGFVYFVDRSGDTFRWKGENVSTQEVEELLAPHPGITTVNVYGVLVPGHEGRAGMAAITAADPDGLDLAGLHARAVSSLPGYAIPLFLRLGRESDMTATFKLRKTRLRDEGYDPAVIHEDRLYVRDEKAQTYVPLSDEALRRLDLPAFRCAA